MFIFGFLVTGQADQANTNPFVSAREQNKRYRDFCSPNEEPIRALYSGRLSRRENRVSVDRLRKAPRRDEFQQDHFAGTRISVKSGKYDR